MIIREMGREECIRVLAGASFARLACSYENQPYVVPVYLAYHEPSGYLYGFTTPGQKVEWMRANPLVCIEVDEVESRDQWVSVVASGRYEELRASPRNKGASLRAPERPRLVGEDFLAWSAPGRQRQCNDERELAWQILKTQPEWWEPGCAVCVPRAGRDPTEPYCPIYYRIRIDCITGREAAPDPRDAVSRAVKASSIGRWGRLRKTLESVLGGRSKKFDQDD